MYRSYLVSTRYNKRTVGFLKNKHFFKCINVEESINDPDLKKGLEFENPRNLICTIMMIYLV